MREIKFRGWDNLKKKMVGDPHWELSSTGTEYLNDTLESLDSVYTLMQYTGLNDKNNNPIFEGDIVRYARHNNIITATVAWREGEGCYHLLNHADPFDSDSLISESMFFIGSERLEIIGNIYENPELLK